MKNENLNSKIGEWLQNKRIEKGLSQQDVADAMNITRTAVHYWESGKRTIYAENMFDYCRVHLHVTSRTLVHGRRLLLVRTIKKRPADGTGRSSYPGGGIVPGMDL